MNIVHLSIVDPFSDGFTYQENVIAKYHVKLGYDVTIIAPQWQWGKNNNRELVQRTNYTDENHIHIVRLPLVYGTIDTKLKLYRGLYKALQEQQPDILFIHRPQFLDIFTVLYYLKKHSNVKVYVDNHADFSNSARNWVSKNILHKIIWRICAQAIEPYVTKFYGVLPARVDFLKGIYKLPAKKCELLVMGADDEMVERASKPEVRARIRQKYNIKEDDFLIVTGGKIDAFKTQTLLLMQAVQNIKNPKVKLLVFGSVTKELQAQVKQLTDGCKVQSIGWINGQDSYKYFAAADLACFPGRHSVFWEQVVGQGIPLLVKDWSGTHHVDVGGNVRFLTKDSVEDIQENIEFLLNNQDKYQTMKQVAQQDGMRYFSYRDIAKKSIEIGD